MPQTTDEHQLEECYTIELAELRSENERLRKERDEYRAGMLKMFRDVYSHLLSLPLSILVMLEDDWEIKWPWLKES